MKKFVVSSFMAGVGIGLLLMLLLFQVFKGSDVTTHSPDRLPMAPQPVNQPANSATAMAEDKAEAVERPRFYHRFRTGTAPEFSAPARKAPSLRLLIHPSKVGTADLLLRVEVWNLSLKMAAVHPIDPLDYQPDIRYRSGEEINIYSLYRVPPIDPPMLHLADLAQVPSGQCLSSNFLLPNFYKSVKAGQDMKCRIRVHRNYLTSKSRRRIATFELASEWVWLPR